MNADTVADNIQTIIQSRSMVDLYSLLEVVDINKVYSWPDLLTFTILDIVLQSKDSKKYGPFATEVEIYLRSKGGKTYDELLHNGLKRRPNIPRHPTARPGRINSGIALLPRHSRRSRRSRRSRKN